jgi:hypothetical protein
MVVDYNDLFDFYRKEKMMGWISAVGYHGSV